MTWFDYAVLAIVGLSVLFSVIHGFVRELLALASWVVAFLAAQFFVTDAAPFLPFVTSPSLRLLVAFCVVFVAVLVAMSLLAIVLSGLVKKAGLGAADRLLGAIFGFMRGAAIVMLVVLMAGLTSLPKQPAWQHAILSPPLETLANMIKVWLPNDLSKHIHYGQVTG
jgi:membrane protein required for colicin V production